MTTRPFLNYFQAFEIIKANYPKSLELLQKISEYFLEISENIRTVHVSIEETQKGMRGLEDKPMNFSIPPNLSSWSKLQEPLNLSTLFHFMAEDIKLTLDKKLQTFINEYKRDYDELFKKIDLNIKKQKEAEKLAKDAHDKYMKLGNDVQQAYNNNQMDKVAKLREEFVKAQDTAVELHKSLNGRTLLSCTLFEQSLSNYEKLERKRIETVKSVYAELINRINVISDFYNAKAELISTFTKDFDPKSESEKLKSMVQAKNSLCNQVFQPINVSPQITKFLDLNHVFKEEITKGGKIVIATNDFSGDENQLSVSKDEHLVTIQEEGDQFLCKNINDLVGLVPKSVLQFVE